MSRAHLPARVALVARPDVLVYHLVEKFRFVLGVHHFLDNDSRSKINESERGTDCGAISAVDTGMIKLVKSCVMGDFVNNLLHYSAVAVSGVLRFPLKSRKATVMPAIIVQLTKS